MNNPVFCPYCRAKMVYKQLDHINGFFECPQCLSTGPAGRGKNDAYELAQRRCEPPIRALTFAELKNAVHAVKPVVLWVEDAEEKSNEGWKSSDVLGMWLDEPDTAQLYGAEWRCWTRCPTNEESAAVKWEDVYDLM